MTTMRSVRPMTNSMSCSTSRMLRPSAFNCRSTSPSARFSLCRSPAAGSSSSSRAGSVHSARAISSRRCGPRARLPASSCILSAMPMRASCRSASANRHRSSARSSPSMACTALLRVRRYPPRATFSSTVMSGIIFTCWKVRDMPRRAMSREGSPAIDSPRNCTAPRVRGSTPVTRLNVVDLPAPLGPIRPTMSPAWIWKLTSFTATRPPNSLRTACTSSSSSPRDGLSRAGKAAAPSQSRGRSRRTVHRPAKDHRPSGAYFSTTTRTMPKTMTSKLPLVPMSCGSSTCNSSSTTRTTAEPRKAPHTCPTPPSTAMNRYSMPLLMPKGDGLTLRWKCANSQPDTAARKAAMTKAVSL